MKQLNANVIFGFYKSNSNDNDRLVVRNYSQITLTFSDGIETSIDNYWGINGTSIFESTARFQNGYEVNFSTDHLVLIKKNELPIVYKKDMFNKRIFNCKR